MTLAEAAGTSGALERYEAVIGIEIHCQLKTVEQDVLRLLHRDRWSSAEQPLLPGLPGPAGRPADDQQAAVEWVIATGFAIEATIAQTTRWDRKNYFYPDLPKGYQISQYQLPLAAHGSSPSTPAPVRSRFASIGPTSRRTPADSSTPTWADAGSA